MLARKPGSEQTSRMRKKHTSPHLRPLTTAEADALRRIATDRGHAVTAAWIGCSEETLLRLLAGMPTRPGSVALVRAALACAEADGPAAA